MAALQCEICGGKLMGRPGGIFECDSCGMEYDTAWAKEKIQEIKGTVKVEGTVQVAGTIKLDGPVEVKGNANVKSMLKRAQLALEDRKGERAEEYFEKVLAIDPKCAEAYFGLAMLDEGVNSLEALVQKHKWENKNYRRGKQFADSSLLSRLKRLEEAYIAKKPVIKALHEKTCAASCLFSAGDSHTIGVMTDGRIMAAGENPNGRSGDCCDISGRMNLGDNTKDVVAVAAGISNSVALLADGTVAGEGYNTDQLGEWKDITAISASSIILGLRADGSVVAAGRNPLAPWYVSDWRNVTAIVAAYGHAVGLKADGTVVATGAYNKGQCDVNSWRDIIAIAAAGACTVGLKSDGTVTVTGTHIADSSRQIEEWTEIIAISAGGRIGCHIVGLRSDGTVVAAGRNDEGQCDVCDWKDIVAVSAGNGYTVGLKADGTLVATGKNDKGQCNIGNWKLFQKLDSIEQERAAARPSQKARALKYQQEQLRLQKKEEEELLTQKQRMKAERKKIEKAKYCLTIGYDHIVGLNEDGTVVAAGSNAFGQCNVSRWRKIVAIAAAEHFTVGLKADGTVVTAGTDITDKSNVSGWRDIVAIAAAHYHTVGLRADGTVVATGGMRYGEEGQCEVSGWRDIVAIAANDSFTYGLKRDGTVLTVGGRRGEIILSERDAVEISACSNNSVRLRSDGTVACLRGDAKKWQDIVAIAAGDHFTVGLKADGTVVLAANSWVDFDVSGWKDIVAIAAGNNHIAGLIKDGTVVIAGDRFGKLQEANGWRLFQNFTSLESAQQRAWKAVAVCQHCGGDLRGFLSKKCISCGKPKDY